MKSERLFRILGLIDEDLIEEAATSVPAVSLQKKHWKPLLAAAACVAVICVLSVSWLANGRFQSLGAATESAPQASNSSAEEGSTEESSGGDAGDMGIATDTEALSVEGTTFMSYAGPVFPLTLLEEIDGITAERKTTWDFATGSYQDGDPRQWGAEVSDSYILMNHTTGEIMAMASYPVAGSFDKLSEHLPAITVDGEETDWTLYAGPYAGGFQNAGIDDGSTWNLAAPDSWTDYQALLEDDAYLEQTFKEYPELELPVTVYEFTNFTSPGREGVEQAFSCTVDEDATTVLSYGFNSLWYDLPEAPNWRQYGYSASRAILQEDSPKYIIVLGEDVKDPTLRSIRAKDEEVVDGVFCKMERLETTLGGILTQICREYREEYLDDWEQHPTGANTFSQISAELFRDLTATHLLQYGPLSDTPTDRYADGRLDELIQEILYFDRVLYLTIPVTIPAGGSVTVTAELWKEPSFDYGCSTSENVGLQGYDHVTTLGSTLDFTIQTAALTNTENVEIVNQNFGFDPETGITEVTLNPTQEHYYLEIRSKT